MEQTEAVPIPEWRDHLSLNSQGEEGSGTNRAARSTAAAAGFEIGPWESSSFRPSGVLPTSRGDILRRRLSAAMLCAGCIMAFLAFAIALLVGVNRSFQEADTTLCFFEEKCKSGRNYHAETVSELVSKPGMPHTTIFYSFATIGSICIIVSRYPWELRNVYTGSNTTRQYCSWVALRTIIPPVGMMIVTQVPVVPRVERTNLGIKIAVNIHTFGAGCFIAGYIGLEVIALRALKKNLDALQLRVRWASLYGCIIFCIIFLVANALHGGCHRFNICCEDQWMKAEDAFRIHYGWNVTDPMDPMDLVKLRLYEHNFGRYALMDTAHGWCLTLKKTSFWAEAIAGLFVIFSHAAVWFFCEERRLDVPDIEDTRVTFMPS
jgi:hypothetical protein